MSVYKRGDIWWYKFRFSGREIRESAKTPSKTVAREAERVRHRELEEAYNNVADRRDERIRTICQTSASYLEAYVLKNPRSAVFAQYAVRHLNEQIGQKMLVDVNDETVKSYQLARLRAKAAPKTVNEEVGFLLRLLGEQGDAIRIRLKRNNGLKLTVRNDVGKAYSREEKAALLEAASVSASRVPQDDDVPGTGGKRPRGGTRSPYIRPALALAFSAGMRNGEIRTVRWGQIDFDRRILTVGRSKTAAGEGRTIPMNDDLFAALVDHAKWYAGKFGTAEAGLYIFPARVGSPKRGSARPLDPTKPVTTLKTSWQNAKKRAAVVGRFHDTRHTLITELCEAGTGDQTIMEIAGHVSPQMLKRYGHIRMEAKRAALESIQTKPEASTPSLTTSNQPPAMREDSIQ
jgi:integrase